MGAVPGGAFRTFCEPVYRMSIPANVNKTVGVRSPIAITDQVNRRRLRLENICEDLFGNLAGPFAEERPLLTPQSPPETSSRTCGHRSVHSCYLAPFMFPMWWHTHDWGLHLTCGKARRCHLVDAGLRWKILRGRGRTPPAGILTRPAVKKTLISPTAALREFNLSHNSGENRQSFYNTILSWYSHVITMWYSVFFSPFCTSNRTHSKLCCVRHLAPSSGLKMPVDFIILFIKTLAFFATFLKMFLK